MVPKTGCWRPSLYSIIVLALAAAVLLFFGPTVLGRAFTNMELVVSAFTVAAMIAGWQLVMRKRARQKLERMRDSALW